MKSDKKDFKVGDVWLSRSGGKVLIVKTDMNHHAYPILGVHQLANEEYPRQYTAAGSFYAATRVNSAHDLVKKYEEPVGPEEIKVFVNKATGYLGYATAIGATILPQDSRKGWVLVKYRRVDEE